VVTGQSVTDVNFELEIISADLACKAIDQYGGPVNPVDVEITGPEGTVTGIIEGDSLVFQDLPYGMYDGIGVLMYSDTAWASDEMNENDHDIVFVYDLIGVKENKPCAVSYFQLSPNPSSGEVLLSWQLDQADKVNLRIYSINGQLVRVLADRTFDAGLHQLKWDGRDEAGNMAGLGAYAVVLQTSSGTRTVSIIRIKR
jgi:hypothetical protein